MTTESTKDKKDLFGAVHKTMGEITDLLQKSGYSMEKEEPPVEEPPMAPPAPEGEMPPEMPPEAAPEGEMPPEMPPEAAPEGEMPPEAAPEGEMSEQEMQAMVSELSDEELDVMISALMAEKDSRSQTPEEGGEPAPAPLEQSMKEDFLKLTKSLEAVNTKLDKLEKASEKPAPTKVVTKPVATNAQPLEKSDKTDASTGAAKGRLSKSQSLDFMIGQVRKGNKDVEREDVAEMNLAQSQEEVNEIQDRLAVRGLEFPKI